ncbi:putative leucine-rich repeat domain, L domain-containing protein [Medicago truncatula]|uniref:Putative leucine-rich repeat domain, L domain-containing protein n=1 Tax=Medicago truncatula TaxID=3880 RepID=A0A396JGF2_MEDTR|nr:putative leucine-rich repeat domain, L domain-containing protein [Medicago truncatula]
MSLVSPRYLHLWKDLQAFDFYFDRSIPFEKASLFVNSVLSLRKSRDIQKFHLTLTFDRYKSFDIKKFQAKCVEIWILAAIGPHLQELILSISSYCIKLPPSFFINCTNLVSLRFSGAIDMLVQDYSVHFPSLKKLSLGADIVCTPQIHYFSFSLAAPTSKLCRFTFTLTLNTYL